MPMQVLCRAGVCCDRVAPLRWQAMGNAHGDPGRVTDLLVNLGACYQLQGKFSVVRAATLPRPAAKLLSACSPSTPPQHPPPDWLAHCPLRYLPHVIVPTAGHVTGLASWYLVPGKDAVQTGPGQAAGRHSGPV